MYFVVFSILKINVIPCFLSWTDSTLFHLVLVSTLEVVVFTSGLFPRFVRPTRLPAGHRLGPDSLAVFVTTPCSSTSLLFQPIYSQPCPVLYRFPSHIFPRFTGSDPVRPGYRPASSRSSPVIALMYLIQAISCCYAFSKPTLHSRSAF
jgi:hypothetical protein